MENQDKIYEIEINSCGIGGKLRIQNSNNRVLAKIGDVLLDKLNYYRWNNAVKFFEKYEQKKTKRSSIGKETPLPPKFLFEILGNAFMEEADEVQDLWANLLSNWQFAENRTDIAMVFIEILKNLSKNEIRILSAIHTSLDGNDLRYNKNSYVDGNVVRGHLCLSKEEYELAMLNLFRLYCCEGFHQETSAMYFGDIPIQANGGIEKFRITALGYKLLDMILEKD